MKILTILGARPQFVKAAVVSRAFKDEKREINEIILHTGQHYDKNMSDIFFSELNIPLPDYNLGIGGGTHGQNTGRMVEKIEEVLIKEKPDCVLVYGDTDSTIAGALAAVKLHIKVAHVEAGLRSFNRKMPEEINRVLTDHASDTLFTPTKTATSNLIKEGINKEKIKQVGDVMYDAALYYSEMAEKRSDVLERLNLKAKEYILATIHRAENTDNETRLRNIVAGFGNSSDTIIWPIHPRTIKQIERFNISLPENLKTIDAVGYLDMVMLEKNSRFIATDSGGVQKEAYFHQIPCITLRDETEWVELVDLDYNRLVSPNDKSEVTDAMIGFTFPEEKNTAIFGNGKAGKLIVEVLQE